MDDLSELLAQNFNLTQKQDIDVDAGGGSDGINLHVATYDVVGRVVSEKTNSSYSLQQSIDRLLRPVRSFTLQSRAALF